MTRDTGGAATRVQAWLHAKRKAFDGRSLRERLLITAACTAAAFMVADALWLTPTLQQWNKLQAQRKTASTQGAQQQQALQVATVQRVTQQRQLQTEIDAARLRVRDAEAWMRVFESTLVGPERMLPLLEQMLTRYGQVRVREFKSLGPIDVLAAGARGAPVAAAAATTTTTTTTTGTGNATGAAASPPLARSVAAAAATRPAGAPTTLYRHGVELTLEGSFGDLMNYVAGLEELPQRVLWGALSFRVEQHPRAVLKLQLFTLSSARHWIEI